MDANYGMKVKYKMDVSYIIKKMNYKIQKLHVEFKNEV